VPWGWLARLKLELWLVRPVLVEPILMAATVWGAPPNSARDECSKNSKAMPYWKSRKEASVSSARIQWPAWPTD
jgi:hypothetical protein